MRTVSISPLRPDVVVRPMVLCRDTHAEGEMDGRVSEELSKAEHWMKLVEEDWEVLRSGKCEGRG